MYSEVMEKRDIPVAVLLYRNVSQGEVKLGATAAQQSLKDRKFEAWKHGLLDVSKRNKMLNYRKTKRTTLES